MKASPDARRRQLRRIPFKMQSDLCPIGKPAKSRDQLPKAVAGEAGDLVHVIEVAPRNAMVEMNSYRSADVARIGLNFRDFPMDPRIVRAVGVEVYLGAVTPDRFSFGAGFNRSAALAALSRFQPIDGPPVFVGAADSLASEHTARGENVTIHARDLTACFLDTTLASLHCTIDTSGSLSDVLERILRIEGAAWEGMQLDVRTADGEENERVNLTGIDQAKAFTRTSLGADGKTPQMPQGVDNWWDVVTIICLNAGVIPQVTLSKDSRRVVLAISTPKSLFGTDAGTRRRFIYGRNLTDLSFERKMAGVHIPAVTVLSWDPKTKTVLKAFAPKELAGQGAPAAQTPNTATPSNQNETVTSITQLVRGIRDKARLQRIADSLYQQVGRQEMTGRYQTKDLLAFTDTEIDPADIPGMQFGDLSLLTLRSGDPIEVMAAATNGGNDRTTYGELLALSTEALRARLQNAGYERAVAETMANYLKGNGMQSVFRQRTLRMNFDNRAGIRFEGDFCNYYEIREDDTFRKAQTG